MKPISIADTFPYHYNNVYKKINQGISSTAAFTSTFHSAFSSFDYFEKIPPLEHAQQNLQNRLRVEDNDTISTCLSAMMTATLHNMSSVYAFTQEASDLLVPSLQINTCEWKQRLNAAQNQIESRHAQLTFALQELDQKESAVFQSFDTLLASIQQAFNEILLPPNSQSDLKASLCTPQHSLSSSRFDSVFPRHQYGYSQPQLESSSSSYYILTQPVMQIILSWLFSGDSILSTDQLTALEQAWAHLTFRSTSPLSAVTVRSFTPTSSASMCSSHSTTDCHATQIVRALTTLRDHCSVQYALRNYHRISTQYCTELGHVRKLQVIFHFSLDHMHVLQDIEEKRTKQILSLTATFTAMLHQLHANIKSSLDTLNNVVQHENVTHAMDHLCAKWKKSWMVGKDGKSVLSSGQNNLSASTLPAKYHTATNPFLQTRVLPQQRNIPPLSSSFEESSPTPTLLQASDFISPCLPEITAHLASSSPALLASHKPIISNCPKQRTISFLSYCAQHFAPWYHELLQHYPQKIQTILLQRHKTPHSTKLSKMNGQDASPHHDDLIPCMIAPTLFPNLDHWHDGSSDSQIIALPVISAKRQTVSTSSSTSSSFSSSSSSPSCEGSTAFPYFSDLYAKSQTLHDLRFITALQSRFGVKNTINIRDMFDVYILCYLLYSCCQTCSSQFLSNIQHHGAPKIIAAYYFEPLCNICSDLRQPSNQFPHTTETHSETKQLKYSPHYGFIPLIPHQSSVCIACHRNARNTYRDMEDIDSSEDEMAGGAMIVTSLPGQNGHNFPLRTTNSQLQQPRTSHVSSSMQTLRSIHAKYQKTHAQNTSFWHGVDFTNSDLSPLGLRSPMQHAHGRGQLPSSNENSRPNSGTGGQSDFVLEETTVSMDIACSSRPFFTHHPLKRNFDRQSSGGMVYAQSTPSATSPYQFDPSTSMHHISEESPTSYQHSSASSEYGFRPGDLGCFVADFPSSYCEDVQDGEFQRWYSHLRVSVARSMRESAKTAASKQQLTALPPAQTDQQFSSPNQLTFNSPPNNDRSAASPPAAMINSPPSLFLLDHTTRATHDSSFSTPPVPTRGNDAIPPLRSGLRTSTQQNPVGRQLEQAIPELMASLAPLAPFLVGPSSLGKSLTSNDSQQPSEFVPTAAPFASPFVRSNQQQQHFPSIAIASPPSQIPALFTIPPPSQEQVSRQLPTSSPCPSPSPVAPVSFFTSLTTSSPCPLFQQREGSIKQHVIKSHSVQAIEQIETAEDHPPSHLSAFQRAKSVPHTLPDNISSSECISPILGFSMAEARQMEKTTSGLQTPNTKHRIGVVSPQVVVIGGGDESHAQSNERSISHTQKPSFPSSDMSDILPYEFQSMAVPDDLIVIQHGDATPSIATTRPPISSLCSSQSNSHSVTCPTLVSSNNSKQTDPHLLHVDITTSSTIDRASCGSGDSSCELLGQLPNGLSSDFQCTATISAVVSASEISSFQRTITQPPALLIPQPDQSNSPTNLEISSEHHKTTTTVSNSSSTVSIDTSQLSKDVSATLPQSTQNQTYFETNHEQQQQQPFSSFFNNPLAAHNLHIFQQQHGDYDVTVMLSYRPSRQEGATDGNTGLASSDFPSSEQVSPTHRHQHHNTQLNPSSAFPTEQHTFTQASSRFDLDVATNDAPPRRHQRHNSRSMLHDPDHQPDHAFKLSCPAYKTLSASKKNKRIPPPIPSHFWREPSHHVSQQSALIQSHMVEVSSQATPKQQLDCSTQSPLSPNTPVLERLDESPPSGHRLSPLFEVSSTSIGPFSPLAKSPQLFQSSHFTTVPTQNNDNDMTSMQPTLNHSVSSVIPSNLEGINDPSTIVEQSSPNDVQCLEKQLLDASLLCDQLNDLIAQCNDLTQLVSDHTVLHDTTQHASDIQNTFLQHDSLQNAPFQQQFNLQTTVEIQPMDNTNNFLSITTASASAVDPDPDPADAAAISPKHNSSSDIFHQPSSPIAPAVLITTNASTDVQMPLPLSSSLPAICPTSPIQAQTTSTPPQLLPPVAVVIYDQHDSFDDISSPVTRVSLYHLDSVTAISSSECSLLPTTLSIRQNAMTPHTLHGTLTPHPHQITTPQTISNFTRPAATTTAADCDSLALGQSKAFFTSSNVQSSARTHTPTSSFVNSIAMPTYVEKSQTQAHSPFRVGQSHRFSTPRRNSCHPDSSILPSPDLLNEPFVSALPQPNEHDATARTIGNNDITRRNSLPEALPWALECHTNQSFENEQRQHYDEQHPAVCFAELELGEDNYFDMISDDDVEPVIVDLA